MKKVLFSIAFLGIAIFSMGQDEPQNVIKVNPLGILFGSANIAFERAISEKSSVVIAPSFGGFKLGGMKYSNVGIGAEYRYYLGQSTAPAKLYVSPGVGFSSGKVKYEWDVFGEEGNDKIKFTSLNAKAVIGHQWIWDSGFTLDLNGGVSYWKFKYKDDEDAMGLKGNGILPALGLSIGYAF